MGSVILKRTLTVLLFAMFGLPLAWSTVGQQPYTATFTCTGSAGPYAFTYPISDPTSMTVTIDGSIVDPAVYTIVPINNNYDNGGTVTLQSACIAGHILVLNRFTDKTQATVYVANIPVKTTERDLDKSTEIDQEIWGRTVHSIQTQTSGANVGIPSSGGDITYNFTNCTVVGSQVGQVPSTQNLFTITCPDGGGGSTITGPQYAGVYLSSTDTPAFDPRITSNSTSWVSTHTAGIFAPIVTATGPNHAISIPNGGTEAPNTLTMQSGVLYNNTTPLTGGSGAGPGGSTGQVQANGGGGNFSAATDPQKGMVNVLTDCPGVTGDGVTDDGPAIQACIDAHPGRTIMFPKTQASNSGGGTAGTVDYYSSQALTMNGNSQHLIGNVGSIWSGGSKIKFASGVNGIIVPTTVYSGKISNLELAGGDCWAQGNITTWWFGKHDGILLYGGEPELDNDIVTCFDGNGIYVNGYSPPWEVGVGPSQPDLWQMFGIVTVANHGNGVAVEGGDSNLGVLRGYDGRFNQRWAILENSALGNTYDTPHTTGNGNNPLGAPGAVSRKFSYIRRQSNVVTACPFTNVTGFNPGDQIVVSEVNDDTSFNGLPFTVGTVTASFVCPGNTGNTGKITWAQTGADTADLNLPGGGFGIASTITAISRTSNVVTVTANNNLNMLNGNKMWITLSGTPIDGTYYTATVSGNTATFPLLGTNFSGPNSGYVFYANSTTLIASGTRTVTDAAIIASTVSACASCMVIAQDAQFGPRDVGSPINLIVSGTVYNRTITRFVNTTSIEVDSNVVLASNIEIDWNGGWDRGPYLGNTNAAPSVWINPYEESNQPVSKFLTKNIIEGGNFPTNKDWTFGVPYTNLGTGTIYTNGQSLHSPKDVQTHWQWQAGTVTDQNQIFEVFNHTGNVVQAQLAETFSNGDFSMLNGSVYKYAGTGDFTIQANSTASINFNKGYGLADFKFYGNCSGPIANIMTLQKTGNLLLNEPCNATAITGNFNSNAIQLASQYWNGSSGASDTWKIVDNLGTGTTPTSTLRIGRDVGGQKSPGQGTVSMETITLDAFTFANLGTPAAVGTMRYCSNCQVTTAASCSTATPASCVCAAGGTGAMAKYMNYQANGVGWYCQS